MEVLKNINSKAFILLFFVSTVLFSCAKEKGLAEDPYKGGKVPLGVKFISTTTNPSIVNAGSELELKINGLAKYANNFKLYVNEVEAEVLEFTDSTVRFKVPLNASTGSVWVAAEGQSFFGPIVKVGGKVSVDATWKIINGATNENGNSTVYDIELLTNGRYWVGGAFRNFELKATSTVPIGGVAQLDANGGYLTTDINFGKGVGGGLATITSLVRVATGSQAGKFIIAGSFSSYNSTRPNRQTLNNVARLLSNGTLDSLIVPEIVNPDPAQTWKNADTVSAFNSGVDGLVRKALIFGEQIYFVGDFNNYKRMFLRNSTYDDKSYDLTRMRQLVRVNMDGTMDSTFHFNKATRQSPIGANGSINDALVQADGKLIIVGSFTSYDGAPANRIARLNLDGSLDNTFAVGSGANDDINSIRLNPITNKFILSGNFNTFNGKQSSCVTLLNSDGSNDNTFASLPITGGIATFAAQLRTGKILISGSFTRYGNEVRQGFIILNSNGELAQGYNNVGGFQGRVYDMLETSIPNGTQVILVGSILRFNTMFPRNVLRLIIGN